MEPSAEADARLRELIRKGITSYRSKDYPATREALLEAIKISPEFLAVGMLADTEMKLKRYRDAAQHWTIYLNAISADQSSERAEAIAQLEVCRKHVGVVSVNVEPGTADVLINDFPTDLTMTKGEIWLEPGVYTLRAKSGSGVSEPQTVAVNAGAKVTVKLVAPTPPPDLTPAPLAATSLPATTPTGVASPDNQQRNATRTYVLIGGGALTLLAAGVGTVAWAMNRSAKNDSEAAGRSIVTATQDRPNLLSSSLCQSSSAPSACADLRSANDRMTHTADAAQVAFVAAGVLGAATVGALLLWPNRERAREPRVALAPYWTSQDKGVAARLVF
jgi:hypothetical protein